MRNSAKQLDDFLRSRLKRALDELAGIDPDGLLNENAEVVVATLVRKHLPAKLAVDWEDATRSPVTEVTTHVRDAFERDRVYAVSASKVIVSYPISGTTEMLGYQASMFSWSPSYGTVANGAVLVEVVERELTPDKIHNQISQVRNDIDRRIGWANADLERFQSAAQQEIRTAYEDRRKRILNDRAVEDALGIPVRTSTARRQPIAAHRRQITLETRRAQSGFVPEPVLEEAIYEDILEAATSWAASLERTPKTAAKLDEEELRDLLLGTLNGYWRGAAGGELFNGSGKTDILIREADRNAFIAECKIWRGPKGIADALDQLLSYLVWRDSKAALVVFIKTSDPSATVQKLHAAVESHGSHVLTKKSSDPSRRMDYIVTADKEGRRVCLAVLPVVIREDAP